MRRCFSNTAIFLGQTYRLLCDHSRTKSKRCGQNCMKKCKVREAALYIPDIIQADWLKGVADGSGQSLVDIVALNVRTEIAFGKFSDGCTSLAWHSKNNAFLGQNWDVSSRSVSIRLIKLITSSSGKKSRKKIWYC